MGSRHIKSGKKIEIYNTNNIDNFVERLRKIRALNCSPSDVGIGSHLLRRMAANKPNFFTKLT